MGYCIYKYLKSSKYQNVYKYLVNGVEVWTVVMKVNHRMLRKKFDNERDAAIFVDKKLIEYGKEPINILIKKT